MVGGYGLQLDQPLGCVCHRRKRQYLACPWLGLGLLRFNLRVVFSLGRLGLSLSLGLGFVRLVGRA